MPESRRTDGDEDSMERRARDVASDIDAILHGGQRAEMRFRKIVPTIEAALRAVEAETIERDCRLILQMAEERRRSDVNAKQAVKAIRALKG